MLYFLEQDNLFVSFRYVMSFKLYEHVYTVCQCAYIFYQRMNLKNVKVTPLSHKIRMILKIEMF